MWRICSFDIDYLKLLLSLLHLWNFHCYLWLLQTLSVLTLIFFTFTNFKFQIFTFSNSTSVMWRICSFDIDCTWMLIILNFYFFIITFLKLSRLTVTFTNTFTFSNYKFYSYKIYIYKFYINNLYIYKFNNCNLKNLLIWYWLHLNAHDFSD